MSNRRQNEEKRGKGERRGRKRRQVDDKRGGGQRAIDEQGGKRVE